MIKFITIILFFTFFAVAPAQTRDSTDGKMLTVTGDSLVGYSLNGGSVREVFGNVVIVQSDITITCDSATHYVARNDAKLSGNVVLRQKQVVITTEEGFYYGNEKRAFSNTGVTLDDGRVVLSADTGRYSFPDKIARFEGRVKLVDSVSTLTSEKLTYYRELTKAVAVGDVQIVSKANIIKADSLIHFRNTEITHAFENVAVSNRKDNVTIFGGRLEDNRAENTSLIEEKPLMMQIDTTDAGVLDTLLIAADVMEAFRDPVNIFIARDSVEIIRGSFRSKNDLTTLYRNQDMLVTNIRDEESDQPLLWLDNARLSGDSITIYLSENELEKLLVRERALLVSFREEYPGRLDQMTGRTVEMRFSESELVATSVNDGVLSYYYIFEDNQPNGLIKASAKDALIKFSEKKVVEVRMYGDVESEYHPEQLIEGNEQLFYLPDYREFGPPPKRAELLKRIR